MTDNPLLDAWTLMVRIRAFEETLRGCVGAGEIAGHVHLSIGQEAVAAGVGLALRRGDHIASTHRCHGHALAKGADPNAMMAEIFGRASGLCGGRGGSMHLIDMASGMLGGNGIVGAGAPLALGAALSAKALGEDRVAVAFIGDGGANQGSVFEAMNLAAALTLPMIFVIEDNGFGEYTASREVTGTDDLAARAARFGMPAQGLDGGDAVAVLAAAHEAVAHARAGHGPSTLVCKMPRLVGHYEGDPQRYRPAPDLPGGRADGLVRLRDRLIAQGLADDALLDRIAAEAVAEMTAALGNARAAPSPDPRDLTDHIFAAH